MLPVSELDVVNQALLELGRLPVIQISDRADAQLIDAKIDVLLPKLLAATSWNFAIKFVNNNTPNTQSFSPDYLYAYQLPPDYGRFFKFSTNCFPLSYAFVDGLLLTSTKPIAYYYIVNNVDFDAISTLFYRALALYVAADVAFVLTNNAELAIYLEKKYEKEKSDAILLNDMERMIQTTPSNDFDRQVYI